ncbi:hypothetical protein BS47DRAFT_814616 [Hydnum rufescens UP504]|uniref:Cryptic loci regulator 2 C-terminal domain-containing protein n=1 Tax=Hydnum rufescens UP504 TaxID=1448309 RepID=A0A9P6DXR3_9AGAM|nr:hypothetical protein BS47DRAFT_814616 [Hydnum rufescens UP504]
MFDSPTQHVLTELHNDLISGRYYRRGELVWAALDPPICGQNDAEQITFWPGIVGEIHLQVEVNHSSDDSFVPYQNHAYTIHFLAVHQAHVFPEARILPHQAYVQSGALSQRLHVFQPPPNLSHDLSEFTSFRPLQTSSFDDHPYPDAPKFEDALGPYILAVRINEFLTTYFKPIGKWIFYSQESSGGANIPPGNGFSDLASGIKAHHRYQGLWWGAEKLWTGDLVRIKPERSKFPLEIRTAFKPPASTEEHHERRLLFFRIESIYVDHPPDELQTLGGSCKVAGSIYETVDLDFEEAPEPISSREPKHPSSLSQLSSPAMPSSTKGKGRADVEQYPLPKPPPGFKFRQITKPGTEITFPAPLIAGRYYPDILSNPLVGLTADDIKNATK